MAGRRWIVVAGVLAVGVLAVAVVTATAGAAAGGALTGAAALGVAVFEVVVQTGLEPSAASTREGDGRLEQLRRSITKRNFRGEAALLEQMVQHGRVLDVPVMTGVDLVEGMDGFRTVLRCPRLSSGDLAEAWDRERLVVLGEPGHGKTVLALTLAKRANLGPGPVADLLSLNSWATWLDDNPRRSLDDWIVDELVERHSVDRRFVAELVLSGQFIPILDGLDEVPLTSRESCKRAIDAFADRAPPHRSFVVTCRRAEYEELAPRWVADDRRVYVCGLTGEQIAAAIEERCGLSGAWGQIAASAKRGDPDVTRLLSSPLHLDVALLADTPADLVGCDPDLARSQLWERMIETRLPAVRGTTAAEVRQGLTFLASSMRQQGRLEFRLHDLPRYYPRHNLVFGTFRLALGLAISISYNVGLRLALPDIGTEIFATVTGSMTAALIVDSPTLPRTELQAGATRRILATAGILGGIVGATGAYAAAELGWWYMVGGFLLIGGCCALLVGACAWFNEARKVTAKDPSVLDDGPNPLHALSETRVGGSRIAKTCGTAAGIYLLVMLAYTATLVGEPGSPAMAFLDGVLTLTVLMLCVGLFFGVIGGWGSWLYHRWWLPYVMAKQHLIPHRLPQVLDACAAPDSGLLRKSSSYEFRHRELVDYLANAYEHDAPSLVSRPLAVKH